MISFLQKTWPFISLAFLLAFIASVIFYPAGSSWLSIILLLSSLGMALFFTIQKHISPYKEGRITRSKFARNFLLDILGFLLAIAAASYLGGMAGLWLGTSFGLWAGLVASIAIAFLAAWSVRKVWGRITTFLMG